VWLYLLLATLLMAGAWLYSQRPRPVALATYIPASALGYLEINDWPQLFDGLTGTTAWRRLAPAYGISGRWQYAGLAGRILRATGLGPEAALVLARAQTALVVTSLEVRGEEVRPRLALVAETHLSPARLQRFISAQLPAVAGQLFANSSPEASEYGGVAIQIFRGEGDRRLFSAQMDGTWILANHAEALQACLEARLGRAPNMAGDFHWQKTRHAVGARAALFGFVNGPGATRLLRFGAHLIGGRLLGNSPLAEAWESLVADAASQLVEGVTYGMSFENGQVVDRYLWLSPPPLMDRIQPAIEINAIDPRAMRLLPSGARRLTVIRVRRPGETFNQIVRAVGGRLGAVQSYLLHELVAGARAALFGLRPEDDTSAALGDELVSVDYGTLPEDRVWLAAVSNRALMTPLVERFLTAREATLARERVGELEILASSDQKRGAAVFLGDFLALGKREHLDRLIAIGRKEETSLADSAIFKASAVPSPASAMFSYESVVEPTDLMMAALARRLPWKESGANRDQELAKLPLSSSGYEVVSNGVSVESRGVFGNIPFIVLLIEDALGGRR
jgi:hypothetical protein